MGTRTAFAQLLLEEGKIKLNVQPGETVMNSFFIDNTSSESFPVKVYLEDFVYVPPFDGKKNFLPAEIGRASCRERVYVLV